MGITPVVPGMWGAMGHRVCFFADLPAIQRPSERRTQHANSYDQDALLNTLPDKQVWHGAGQIMSSALRTRTLWRACERSREASWPMGCASRRVAFAGMVLALRKTQGLPDCMWVSEHMSSGCCWMPHNQIGSQQASKEILTSPKP